MQVKCEYILENVQTVDIISLQKEEEEEGLGVIFNMQHQHGNT